MNITFKRFRLLYRVYMVAQKLTPCDELQAIFAEKRHATTKALAKAVQELRAYEAKELVKTWAVGIERCQRL